MKGNKAGVHSSRLIEVSLFKNEVKCFAFVQPVILIFVKVLIHGLIIVR